MFKKSGQADIVAVSNQRYREAMSLPNIISQLAAYRADGNILPAQDLKVEPGDGGGKFKRPLTLAAAEQYIELIRARAARCTDVRDFIRTGYMVSRIYLFGSVLDKKPRPNDVDLAISFFTLYENYNEYFWDGERRFRQVAQQVRLLKDGTRQVRFHSISELANLGCACRLIYAHPVYGGGYSFKHAIVKQRRSFGRAP